jgi:hypothetical protein
MAETRLGDRAWCAICRSEICFTLLQLPQGNDYRWIHVHPERAGSAHAATPDYGWRIDG